MSTFQRTSSRRSRRKRVMCLAAQGWPYPSARAFSTARWASRKRSAVSGSVPMEWFSPSAMLSTVFWSRAMAVTASREFRATSTASCSTCSAATCGFEGTTVPSRPCTCCSKSVTILSYRWVMSSTPLLKPV
uniref:Uncharacterized protein n=1 Tax=Ixodes ricinus TaxID=34613 RepID=A0A6B0UR64_IXORI